MGGEVSAHCCTGPRKSENVKNENDQLPLYLPEFLPPEQSESKPKSRLSDSMVLKKIGGACSNVCGKDRRPVTNGLPPPPSSAPPDSVPDLPRESQLVSERQGVPQSRFSQGDKPNLSGNWMLHHTEGDPDSFLSEMGMGFLFRTGASALNYGVGKATAEISQTGDDFDIHRLTADGREFNQIFTVGAGEQTSRSDIGTAKYMITWKYGALHLDATIIKTQKTCTIDIYVNEEDELIYRHLSDGGIEMNYAFHRQEL